MTAIILYPEIHGDLPIRYTHHARERLFQCQLDMKSASELLRGSIKSFIKLDYTKKKYKDRSVEHWVNGTIIFTLRESKSRNTGNPVILVITVTDQRITLPKGLQTDVFIKNSFL